MSFILSNHPLFSQIDFDKEKHTYTFEGQRLTSVSKVVSDLLKPFDSDYWSKRKADERGVDPAVILAEWDAKREASLEIGNTTHTHIQQVLTGQEPDQDRFLALNKQLPQVKAFDDLWEDAKETIEVAGVEQVIGDPELGIAGTFDALFFDQRFNEYSLWDWKTNSRFNVGNRFQTCLPPFDDLEDCELNKYSLQSSLYTLILRRNTTLPLNGNYIVHLASDGNYHIHKAVDLTDRLEKFLLKED